MVWSLLTLGLLFLVFCVVIMCENTYFNYRMKASTSVSKELFNKAIGDCLDRGGTPVRSFDGDFQYCGTLPKSK